MSYDYLILPSDCDHLVRAERLAIMQDNRTLYSVAHPTEYMDHPVNGTATLRLFMNGVEVPRDHAVYGWRVLPDEYSVQPHQKSKIVFNRPVRNRNLILEATYTTISAHCNKCGGTGAMTDFAINQEGSLTRVIKRDKLTQKILKFLLTSKCPFYPGLVSQIKTYVGRKYGLNLTADDISSEVTLALDNLKEVQALQANYQDLDPEEILRSVTSVVSSRDTSDPRLVRTTVLATTSTGQPNKVNIGLRTLS